VEAAWPDEGGVSIDMPQMAIRERSLSSRTWGKRGAEIAPAIKQTATQSPIANQTAARPTPGKPPPVSILARKWRSTVGDQIKTLRDLAANFVRAIDRTALDYESTPTDELKDRVACLVALHEMEKTEAELLKTPTEILRKRLNLLRQVAKAEQGNRYSVWSLSNGELKKRIEYLRLFTVVDREYDSLSDETLVSIRDEAANILRARNQLAKAQAKAQAASEARMARVAHLHAFQSNAAVAVDQEVVEEEAE